MKPPRRFGYLQDWGTYPNKTIVMVGMDHKQCIAHMVRRNYNHELVKLYNAQVPGAYEALAFCWFTDCSSVLWFTDWINDVKHISTLVHETNHLVHRFARYRNMPDEMEAVAYQQEYLFFAIQQKLCTFYSRRHK